MLYMLYMGRCKKNKGEKCGLLSNLPWNPPLGLVFFSRKKLIPIFFVGKCICNNGNEFYVWSYV